MIEVLSMIPTYMMSSNLSSSFNLEEIPVLVSPAEVLRPSFWTPFDGQSVQNAVFIDSRKAIPNQQVLFLGSLVPFSPRLSICPCVLRYHKIGLW